jgi:hypothetical protein
MLQLTLANPGHAQNKLIAIYPETFYTTLLEAAMFCGFNDFITQAKDIGGVISGVTRGEDFNNHFIEVTTAPAPDVFDLIHLTITARASIQRIIAVLSFFFGKE